MRAHTALHAHAQALTRVPYDDGAGLQAAGTTLQGAIDPAAWLDFFLHTELSADYDAYTSSVFMHKVGRPAGQPL